MNSDDFDTRDDPNWLRVFYSTSASAHGKELEAIACYRRAVDYLAVAQIYLKDNVLKICQAFEFLGLKLDLEKNVQSPPATDILVPNAAVRVLIVEAQEDWAIATECWKLAKT